MNCIYHCEKEDSRFVLTNFSCKQGIELLKKSGFYKILWAKNAGVQLLVDGCYVSLKKNQVIFCTPSNIIRFFDSDTQPVTILFNREFYCIKDSDDEVSCIGYLFYGSSTPVTITLEYQQINIYEDIFEKLIGDFNCDDRFQGEMLRTILRRILIASTRLLDKCNLYNELKISENDTIRKFKVLVEIHYRKCHQVCQYAEMMNRSPKTLANIFSKNSATTPLMVISERILLQAKRLLLFSEKSIKEIALELGYTQVSHFSSFFKSKEKLSPSHFRKVKLLDKVA